MKKPKKTRIKVKAPEPTPMRDWSIPTPHWLAQDQARLDYWRALLEGKTYAAKEALQRYADILSVPKTRMTNGS